MTLSGGAESVQSLFKILPTAVEVIERNAEEFDELIIISKARGVEMGATQRHKLFRKFAI